MYDHFPNLNLAHAHDPWPYGTPTASKYEFLGSQDKKKEEKVLRLREDLDKLTVDDVVFQPYVYDEDRDEDAEFIPWSNVSAYNGPLFHPGGFTMYNPRRVLRQFSCIQTIPNEEKFNFKNANRPIINSEKNYTPKYEPTPLVAHWNNMDEYIVPTRELPESIDDPNACEQGYREWYESWSHPFVINHVQQAKAEKAKAKMMEKEAQRIMKNTPKCGDEALVLWNAAVRNFSTLIYEISLLLFINNSRLFMNLFFK